MLINLQSVVTSKNETQISIHLSFTIYDDIFQAVSEMTLNMGA